MPRLLALPAEAEGAVEEEQAWAGVNKPKKCLMVECPMNAVPGAGLCALCDHWARVVLADDKYRYTPPPEVWFKVQS